MYRIDQRQIARLLAVAVPSLVAATLAVAYLQDVLDVPNPSAVYLVAVVLTAFAAGTPGAIIASIASFLLYDYLYTEPRYTFTIDKPAIWLSVILLLFVGVVVGQLVALQRSRAEIARSREREADSLFRLSRALATRVSTLAVLTEVVEILGSQTRMKRVWISLGADDATERVAADTDGSLRTTIPGVVRVLQRMPGDTPAKWLRVHQPTKRPRPASGMEPYRVRIDVGGTTFGSVWALRAREAGEPDRTEVHVSRLRRKLAAADATGALQDLIVTEVGAGYRIREGFEAASR